MANNRKLISLPDRFKILARDNFRCVYCGATAQASQLHIDHVIPRSKGGDDKLENYVVACFACNVGKRDAVLSEIMGRTEYINDEWRVTYDGMEGIVHGYWIERERLNELRPGLDWCSDWLVHIAGKSRVYDIEHFQDAFYQAFLITGTPIRFDWHRSVEKARRKVVNSNLFDAEFQRRLAEKYDGNVPLAIPYSDFSLMDDWRVN